MNMDRRRFLQLGAGGIAASMLPLSGSGCTTSSGPAVVERAGGPFAVADDGTRYEIDSRRHQLLITAPDGSTRRAGGLGRARGQLNFPAAVVVVGPVAYVVDLGNHRVQGFDRDGRVHAILGEGELLYPNGIAALGERLIVADTGNGSLVELGSMRRFGEGRLMGPRTVAAMGENLLVTDVGKRQVVELRDDGSVVRSFRNDWVLPYGVASDGDAVYVVDRSRPEVAVFDRGGRRIDTLSLSTAASHVTMCQGELFVG